MTVKLLVDWKDPSTGRQYRIGNLLDTDDYTEAGLIASKQAQADLTGGTAQTDPVVNHGDGQVVRANPAGTALVVDGVSFLRGYLADAVWMIVPSLFRLRLTGTGTCTVDARDALGNITTDVASYTVSGATDQIEFPYAGDNAVAIRATLTGTCTAEVI